jgi:hypothetical protein
MVNILLQLLGVWDMVIKRMDFLKYLPWLLIVILFAGTTYWQYDAARNARALIAIKNNELMKANLEIGRAHTELVKINQLHKGVVNKLNADIQEEIKKRNATIQSYATLEALYEKEKKNIKIQTKIVYKDKEGNDATNPTLFGHLFTKNEQGELVPVTQLPLNYKDFRITINGDFLKQLLSYKLHQRFRLKLIETKLPTGGFNHYAELIELDDQNKEIHKLKIDHFMVLKGKEPDATMQWWNPKLDLGLGFGLNTKADFKWMGELGLSLSGYGATKDDLTWRFLKMGIGIVSKEGLSLSFSPVQYNLGKNLPLISNFWVSPYAAYDFSSFLSCFGIRFAVQL